MTESEWNKANKQFATNLDKTFEKIGNQTGGIDATPAPVGRAGSLPGKPDAGSPNSILKIAKMACQDIDRRTDDIDTEKLAIITCACEKAAEEREKVFNEAWMRVMLEKENRIQQSKEQVKVLRAALDEIAITGADTLDGYEAANIATAALARFNDGTSK